jgi:hypothetical protein
VIDRESKAWAQAILNKCTGQPSVVRHFDPEKQFSIDIFSAQLKDGITLHATIGLLEINQADAISSEETSEKAEIYTELLLTADEDQEYAGHILAAAALQMIKEGWNAYPNACFKRMVELEYPNANTQHLYFLTPQIIDPALEEVNIGTKIIRPLVALPISDSEFAHWEKTKRDPSKLLRLFDKAKPEISNFNRESIV